MTDFWLNKKILVTGAGGFIGSHLVETLIQCGAIVRAFTHYNSRGDPGLLSMLPKEIFSNIEIVTGDLRDLPAVTTAMKNTEIVIKHPKFTPKEMKVRQINTTRESHQFLIDAVKEALNDPANRYKTILEIAFAQGFNSKTTFNDVFKQFVGTTPSAFMTGSLEKNGTRSKQAS